MKQRVAIWSVLIAQFATLALGTTVSASTNQGLGALTGPAEPEVGTSSAASCDELTGYRDGSANLTVLGLRRLQNCHDR